MVFCHDLYYPPANATRRLHVWLPDDYDRSSERYPVMYMFDGQNLFFDEAATYGTCWGLADFLGGWDKPMVVVGMECSHEGTGRLDEYCPYPMRFFGKAVRPLGEETFRWVLSDVKPWVDGSLRTWGHREATGIGGSSMGGLMSAYGAIRHNDAFGKAACLSTFVKRSGRWLLPELERASVSPDTRVYLGWGEAEQGRMRAGGDPQADSEEARATARLAAGLKARGARVLALCQRGGQHNEASWAHQVPRMMRFLWEDGE